MKLKIFAILTALLLFISVLPVAAATVTVSFDAGANGIDVTGTVPEATKGGDDLLLLVENEEGEGILSAVTKSEYKDGEVEYTFDKQLMSANLSSGPYTVTVSGRSFETPAQTTFTYTNPVMVYNALKDLYDNMADGKTAAQLWGSFNTNADALGLDDTYSGSLTTDDGKSTFAALLKTVERNLPADYTYGVEVAAEIEKVKVVARKASGAAAFAEITDSADFEEWYAEFYEEFGYNDDTEEAEGAEEDDVTPKLISVKSKAAFVRRIVAAGGTLDIDKIKDVLYGSALLTIIETGTDTEVQKIFEGYSSYFPGIDISAYNKLSDRQKATVIGAMSEEAFDTLEAAADEFNKQVEEAEEPISQDKGKNSSSGGSVYLPITPVEEMTETKTFTDMGETPWAEDAVYFLYERGIVNGRTEKTYAPEAFVTRAEFVKMVMVAMGDTDVQTSAKFKDVATDAWYAPYVAAAAELGIVTGDENGNFNPEAQISREDMATILHRTVQGGKAVEAPEFSDSAEISEYAKTAVDFFAEMGVINGLGDGSFGPKKSATRAETAVMLYRLMKADK